MTNTNRNNGKHLRCDILMIAVTLRSEVEKFSELSNFSHFPFPIAILCQNFKKWDAQKHVKKG